MVAVGEYLQGRRLAAGYTQEDVASELQVRARTVSDWEAGRYIPSFDLMARFVRMVNGRIDEVVRLLFEDSASDKHADFVEFAASLSDEELEQAIQAIRDLRAQRAAAPAPPLKLIRRRSTRRQK